MISIYILTNPEERDHHRMGTRAGLPTNSYCQVPAKNIWYFLLDLLSVTINIFIHMMFRHQRKKGSQHIRKAPITTPKVTKALCSFKSNFEFFFSAWKLNTFRHDEFMRRLSFITEGESDRLKWWISKIAHLQVYSLRRWQKRNSLPASEHRLWLCQGWSCPGPPERNSATRSGFCSRTRQGCLSGCQGWLFQSQGCLSAGLGSTSSPPSEALPHHAAAVFFAS